MMERISILKNNLLFPLSIMTKEIPTKQTLWSQQLKTLKKYKN